MRLYCVEVCCCGPQWLIHVPAVDRWTVTGDKAAIQATARQMIAAALPDDRVFELHLVAGRAVRDAAEVAAGRPARSRWYPVAEPRVTPRDPAGDGS